MKMLVMATLLLISAASCSGQRGAANDSARFESLMDRLVRDYVRLCPEEGSQLGLSRQSGYEFDRSALDDASEQGLQAVADLYRRYLKELRSVDQARLSDAQRTDAKILRWLLAMLVEGDRFRDHGYLVNFLYGVHMQMVTLMTEYHAIESEQDAINYLTRLEKIPARMDQVAVRLSKQTAAGILPPRVIFDWTMGSMQEFRGAEPGKNLLVATFRQRLAGVARLDEANRGKYADSAEKIVREQIYPAYDRFMARLAESRAKADDREGVWKLPKGDQYYRYCLKNNLTTTIDPEKLHQLGIQQVELLQRRGRAILDSMGIAVPGSYGSLMREYWSQPAMADNIYPETSEGRKQALSDNAAWLDSTWQRLPEAFSYIPKERVAVEAVPPHKEGGGQTYYESASQDGSRKATYYINLGQLAGKPPMRVTLYHETVPGHHFQIATQHELAGGRMYRNLFFLSGFGEGWAMYAQALADELGWCRTPAVRLAEVNSQMFRAVRIVLDTGIHSKRWTRQRALKYMEDNLGWASEAEINRYIIWPGQACSYLYGELKILELRERARRKLGDRFDMKGFHQTVLRNGSVPLELLEEEVDAYVAAAR